MENDVLGGDSWAELACDLQIQIKSYEEEDASKSYEEEDTSWAELACDLQMFVHTGHVDTMLV